MENAVVRREGERERERERERVRERGLVEMLWKPIGPNYLHYF